jgi:hypothetical protein
MRAGAACTGPATRPAAQVMTSGTFWTAALLAQGQAARQLGGV